MDDEPSALFLLSRTLRQVRRGRHSELHLTDPTQCTSGCEGKERSAGNKCDNKWSRQDLRICPQTAASSDQLSTTSSRSMSTFSDSQRDQLSCLWSQKAKRDNISSLNKRIHDEEQEQIRQQKEERIRSKKKQKEARNRKRKVDTADHANVVRDRSQELAAKSRGRLSFSRFRSMNEFLYTHSTNEAVHFMDDQSFDLYHTAYSEIADKWPVRPIDHICGLMHRMFKGKGKGKVFADMGCGCKPLIAEAFANATVHSFDLISKDHRITSADVTKLPLPDSVCDCVVFSLSLMGSNVADQIREGSRILKEKGVMIIAEVTSRFKGGEKNKNSSRNQAQRGGGSKESEDCDEEGDNGEEAEIDSLDTFVSKLSTLGLELKKTENLEPNNFFVILEFTRKAGIAKKKNLPDIRLKACQYKPR